MKTILIINQYSENRGDRAVLNALARMLINIGINKIIVSTNNPNNYNNYSFYKENSIEFCEWGWNFENYPNFSVLKRIKNKLFRILFKSIPIYNFIYFKSKFFLKFYTKNSFIHSLEKADIVISTGGHHISTILDQDSINPQTIDISTCLLYKKKVILWSQTIGPLEIKNKINFKFIRNILLKVEKIFVRDKNTFEVLGRLKVPINKIKTIHESVFYLNSLTNFYNPIKKRKNVLGVSIYNVKNRTELDKLSYINTISKFCDYCVKNYSLDIEFFPMEFKNSYTDDRKMINDILKTMQNKNRCYVHDKDYDTEEHLSKISDCRFYLGHKTHSIIFSLTVGTPILALAYHPKAEDFMNQFDFKCFSIPDTKLNYEIMKKIFHQIVEKESVIGKSLFMKSNRLSKDLIKTLFKEIN